jgi:sialate O-acetylesterase
LSFFVALLLINAINAQLKVAGIFGNNAVLQQGIAIPVWGSANPGSKIEVSLGEFKMNTTADDQGKWMLRLNPMKADGKQYELIVASGNEKVTYNNIEIGEVWFASGQSNMSFSVYNVANAEEEIKNANYPDIRFNMIDLTTSAKPLSDIKQTKWQQCTPATVKGFSAVSYFFARELHLDRKVPVGVIVAARGATNLETWISPDRLKTHPDFTEAVEKFDTDTARWNQKVRNAIKSEKDRDFIANNSKVGLDLKVNTIGYNDASWTKTDFPININKMGYNGFWGLVWIRKTFEIPLKSLKKEWKLYLPIKDVDDRIYINGKEIVKGVSKMKEKVISFPVGSFKTPSNLLAIRMYVNWGSAEIGNDKSDCYLLSGDGERIELTGTWTSNNKIEPPVAQWQDYYNSNNLNYNAMVNPVIPYGIKGFLWYQGENNTYRFKQYTELQPLLIDDWRVRWQLGYLPFLYVQIANYRDRSSSPKSSDAMASFRDAQTSTLSRSQNTAMACTIDIGDGNDIHPKNKQDVGKRLYLGAKVKAYGSTEVYSGPIIKTAKLEGISVKLSFDFAQNGLKTIGNDFVKGFAVAGSDEKWVWAEAKIVGNEIVVSSKEISTPVRVQYAWQSNPDCNLYNAENLPAVPFNVEIKK